MDLYEEIAKSKFALVLMGEHEYEEKLLEVVKELRKHSDANICYVCLSKPYQDSIEHLHSVGIPTDRFFFIDILSSHYKEQQADNCIFLKDPCDLDALHTSIETAIQNHNCTKIIFDTFSSLLMYEQSHELIKFGHKCNTEEIQSNVSKVLIVLKEQSEISRGAGAFVKDLQMFSDKTIQV